METKKVERSYKKIPEALFSQTVSDRLKRITATLAQKGEEYATNDDRFHNFNCAAKRMSISRGEYFSREDAISWFALKHSVSIDDIVNKTNQGILVTNAMIEEKIGDAINYLILLEAALYAASDEIREINDRPMFVEDDSYVPLTLSEKDNEVGIHPYQGIY